MQGYRLARGISLVSKCMEQAQGRAMDGIRLNRWADAIDIRLKLNEAAFLQWKMERIQNAAEAQFVLYASDRGVF